MTLVADFNSSVSVPFSRFRQVLEDSGRLVEGVAGTTHFAVAQRAAGANMSVDVAAGQAWVEVDTGTRNGYGHVTSDAIANLAVTASNATNPRIDQVVLQWNETSIPTGAGDAPTLTVLAGTPTAGAQITSPTGANYRSGAATLGNDRLLLADLLIPATSTSVTNANIVDRRPSAVAPGAFSAYRAAAVALATGAVIPFDTEEFDASNWFDTTTGRYTPQVPGYYRLSAAASTNAVITAGQFWGIELFKNGSLLKRLQLTTQVTGGGTPHASGSHPVIANGSTDFFDIRVNHNTAASPGVAGGAAFCYFGGELIGKS